jgi:hypothetical protein
MADPFTLRIFVAAGDPNIGDIIGSLVGSAAAFGAGEVRLMANSQRHCEITL